MYIQRKNLLFFVDDASTVKDSTTYFDPCRYILISLTPEQEKERLSYAMVDNPYKNDVGSGYHANYIIRVRIDIKREQLIGWFLL